MWRCLAKHELFTERQEEILDNVSGSGQWRGGGVDDKRVGFTTMRFAGTEVAGRLVQRCAQCSDGDVGKVLHVDWSFTFGTKPNAVLL